MDSNIITLNNISQIDSDDVLLIQKKNGDVFNIDLSQLLQYVTDNTAAGISEYNFTSAGRQIIEDGFKTENLNKIVEAPSSCAEILPYCANKATLEAEITLGTVRRTILFSYDSFIYYAESKFGDVDYYNYTGSVVMNNVIHWVRLQFWCDNHWTCAVYPAN